ncbi:MAG: vitamin K epoxide reductase family protein [Patescibacteria group bacterium]|nr:vitamin K epoxide reductase family protein [Patescibacteria group bacterium]
MFNGVKLNKALWLIFILSLLGLADTGYLTESHLNRTALVCGAVSSLSKCNLVANSSFSSIYGVPVALLGLLFYLAVFFGTAFYFWRGRNNHLLRWLIILAGAGLIFSLYLLYVQAFILKAFCQYCLASDILTIAIFIGLLVQYKKDKKIFHRRGSSIIK